jgi:hypothetical protein
LNIYKRVFCLQTIICQKGLFCLVHIIYYKRVFYIKFQFLKKNGHNALVNDILTVCLVIHDSLHANILAYCHGDTNAAHFGIDSFCEIEFQILFVISCFLLVLILVKSRIDCCLKKY